jgi:hypothetical protein
MASFGWEDGEEEEGGWRRMRAEVKESVSHTRTEEGRVGGWDWDGSTRVSWEFIVKLRA